MITQNTGWEMINKKTNSKDNILPKLFQNSPEKKWMDNFQKVSDIIILTKISDRRM